MNWRRRCPRRHHDHRRNDSAATAATVVISPGIKFLPARSAFCAAGGRSLQRAADIFYTAAGGGRAGCTDSVPGRTDAGRRRRRRRRPEALAAGRLAVGVVTGRNFPMACIPANDTRLLRETSKNALPLSRSQPQPSLPVRASDARLLLLLLQLTGRGGVPALTN